MVLQLRESTGPAGKLTFQRVLWRQLALSSDNVKTTAQPDSCRLKSNSKTGRPSL